jgi:predicted RNA-binding Zn ribbon-like protein
LTVSSGLELIRDFVNTVDLEEGTDRIADPAGLVSWLSEVAGVEAEPPAAADHEAILELREALRGLLLANNGARLDERQLTGLREAAARAELAVSVDGGSVGLRSGRTGLAAFEADLLLTVADSQEHGTWSRLKACPADDCHWAFIDRSKNHSRTWCSMEVCGNRRKTARYRARRS